VVQHHVTTCLNESLITDRLVIVCDSIRVVTCSFRHPAVSLDCHIWCFTVSSALFREAYIGIYTLLCISTAVYVPVPVLSCPWPCAQCVQLGRNDATNRASWFDVILRPPVETTLDHPWTSRIAVTYIYLIYYWPIVCSLFLHSSFLFCTFIESPESSSRLKVEFTDCSLITLHHLFFIVNMQDNIQTNLKLNISSLYRNIKSVLLNTTHCSIARVCY